MLSFSVIGNRIRPTRQTTPPVFPPTPLVSSKSSKHYAALRSNGYADLLIERKETGMLPLLSGNYRNKFGVWKFDGQVLRKAYITIGPTDSGWILKKWNVL